jgi:hypothetical protein
LFYPFSSDELLLGHEKSTAFGGYTAVARGSKDHNIRAQEPESGLSEEAQVKCLMDQATDPNILQNLGRMGALDVRSVGLSSYNSLNSLKNLLNVH